MLNSDIVTITTIGLGLVYLLTAVIALFKRGPNLAAGRLLAFYALLSAAWSFSQLAWSYHWLPFLQDEFVLRLPLYGLFLLAAAYLTFTWAYLRQAGKPSGWWLFAGLWLVLMLALDANLLGLPQVLWSGMGWQILRSGLVLVLLTLGWGILMSAATLLTLRVYRRTQHPVTLNRYKYLAAVLLLMLAGQALVFFSYWTLGNLIHLLAVLTAAYAVLRLRLPAMRQAFLGILSYLFSAGLAVGVYVVVLLGIQRGFQSLPAYAPWVISFTVAVVLAVLLNPLLDRLRAWIDRHIAGARRDRNKILREYSQSISNILDIQVLAEVAVNVVSEAMDVNGGRLFLVDHEKGSDGRNVFHLRRIRARDEDKESTEPVALLEDGPLAKALRYQQRPLTQYELDQNPVFAGMEATERAWVSAMNLDIYVPIYVKDEWIGLLALGPKASGVPYLEDDLDLLSTLAAQTAVALENARLVEGLMRLNGDFRRAFAALDQANRQLERLDRTKSDFISIASHELRTPLTVLNGYSQMLLDEPELASNAYYAKMIKGIADGGQRLHEIVESMLDMAKIDARDLQLDPQPISIASVIDSLYKDLRSALEERSQVMEIKDLKQLPAVEADRDAVRKVFYHLLINAIKYTPDGGRITVSGRPLLPSPVDLPKGGVEIVVSDTGIGVDPRLSELIFVKFYQTGELALHSTGKTKFKGGGPGLGLAIARGIVDAHGGKIWVESPGNDEVRCPGSDFHVMLPVRHAAVDKNTHPLLRTLRQQENRI